MAPKPAVSPETEANIALFKTIGLTQAKAAEAAKSPKSAAVLKELIEQHDLASKGLDEKQAVLVAALAVQSAKLAEAERAYVLGAVLDARLKSVDQVNAATKYLETHPSPVNDKDFDQQCGVGFSITPEELTARVTEYIKSSANAGWATFGPTISSIKSTPELRWANPLELKNTVERVFTELFGAKEAAKPKGKEPKKDAKPKAAKSNEKAEAEASASTSTRSVFEEGFLGKLHKPGDNPQIKPELREAHLAATKGLVYTRFPPEPNGYLHIGHSKAIFVNFGFAAHHNGRCYLRYDDTNPEAEEAQYFESILEMVRWLGFEPWKITYSSDYFHELHALAVELIRRDKAYICHCTGEQIHDHRGGDEGGPRTACVHRTRPISESLAEFENMKNGKYQPGEAILRMKQDLEDGNPQMWDLIAYRVLTAPHHRTGDKWKIYPTYDFTHCLVDSFENISHSLCTTEFIASRVSYEWLCDALEVYKPRQSEYGRLNIQGSVMSKRKILALVKEGHVLGWDDPRMYTLIALRRRGIPPGALIAFVSSLGVSTAPSFIQQSRFDQTVRQYLENTAPRLLMVLRPLKVTIENLPEDYLLMVEKPLHPKVPELGTTSIPFTRTVYIDADDFRLQDSPDYFRLAPGKTVGLFQAPFPITCTSYKTDPATGAVTELICKLENGADGTPVKKPKAFIQWVAEHAPSGSPVRIDETRVFHRLFKSDNPAATADYKADLNPDSLEIVKGALVETGFWALAKRAYADAKRESAARTAKALAANTELYSPGAHQDVVHDDTPKVTTAQLVGKECVRFQGLRVAYFALDKDSRVACLEEPEDVLPGRRQGDFLVLNRIVSLKEDAGKTA
ncbi:glutamine-tRNA ligase [Dentipellis sp. KUC8613]|nr:glutamine-tRNA ligase [Dentipellis sp. KUC8613]